MQCWCYSLNCYRARARPMNHVQSYRFAARVTVTLMILTESQSLHALSAVVDQARMVYTYYIIYGRALDSWLQRHNPAAQPLLGGSEPTPSSRNAIIQAAGPVASHRLPAMQAE